MRKTLDPARDVGVLRTRICGVGRVHRSRVTFASNIVGGARYGYTLLWVLLWSNGMAMLVQYLSAEARHRDRQARCRSVAASTTPRPMVWLLWVGAEVSAIATDLAEFLGAALGFYLLFGPGPVGTRHGPHSCHAAGRHLPRRSSCSCCLPSISADSAISKA